MDGCTGPVEGRGWCATHFSRWQRTGDVQADVPIRKYAPSEAKRVGTCKRCGASFVQIGPGRQRVFCSAECQQAEYREAKSEEVQSARRCHRCGEPARNKTGRPICDLCAVASALRVSRGRTLRPHGVTVDDYETMLYEQGGKCAICGTTEPGSTWSFCVDHNHTTGAVRALLCRNCNIGLGHFGDDLERLRAAVRYLELHE